MRYVQRALAGELGKAARHFPVTILTGPRRAGKTTLLRRCFPEASYHLLEDPDVIARVRGDPRAFLEDLRLPAILDEIQNVPEILNYIRSQVDRAGRRTCRWFLTGSQEASLMRGVTESMAGRAAILQLMPFSCAESPTVSVLRGGYPEALSHSDAADMWFRSYLQTYLERDVRSISSIRDLATFRRFLAILATRSGQTLNRTDVAAPLGVSVPTISEWIGILETTLQIILVPPFYEHLGKRLTKSPKLYFADSGLLCHLLGLASESALLRSPFLGPVFEGFVASEIVKAQINDGKRKELYFYRDQQGLEVDFLVPVGGPNLLLLEAKASRTIRPEAATPMRRLRGLLSRFPTRSFVVHWPSKAHDDLTTVAPGVRMVSCRNIAGLF